MSIETEVFEKYRVNVDRLVQYGFHKDGETYVYTKLLPEEDFTVTVIFDGEMHGSITDNAVGEAYTGYRREDASGYSAGIRHKFVALLTDIRDRCFEARYFRAPQAQRLADFIREALDGTPEFLWEKFPSYAAFRKGADKKWYALIGSVPVRKLDKTKETDETVEVVNVKASGEKLNALLSQKGFYPAWHMNKKTWVSISLDDTVSDKKMQKLLTESYESV